MAVVTQNEYIQGSDGETTRSFTFPYLKVSDVKVSLDGVDQATTTYTLPTATTIKFNTAPTQGQKIKIYRRTDDESLTATFYPGSSIKSEDLNDNFTQNLYTTQEVNARYVPNFGGTMTGDLNFAEGVTLNFEGATADAFETTLTVVDPTVRDQTYRLPNIPTGGSGTFDILTTGDTGSLQTAVLADDAVTGVKIADDTIDSNHYVAGSIDNEHLAADSVTGAKIADDTINSEHYVAGSIDTEHVADSHVTTAKLANNAVTTVKITNSAVDSTKLANASVVTDRIADSAVATAKIADSAVTAVKLANDAITIDKIADGAVGTSQLADNSVTLAKMADVSVGTAELVDDAVTDAKIADNAVKTANIVDSNVTTAKLNNASVSTTKLADDAVTATKIGEARLVTLAAMQSGTASQLAGNTALTSDIADLNQLDGLSKQTSITDVDTSFPTSGAVVEYVTNQFNTVGGLKVIENEDAFPTTQPSSGVVISISDAQGIIVGGTGQSTNCRTSGYGSDNVTINSFPSSLYNETLAAGVGLMVSSTGNGNIYNYHKLLAAETDVKQLSDDINDFNARYRVGSSNPTSALDAGDLFFNTTTQKMLVYDSTDSAWEEVQSVGNFYISTFTEAFDGSRTAFTVSNAPTSAQQLIISINGVIQKPNAGTGAPSEGFTLSSSTVTFSSAPASGSDYFAIVMGSTVNIGTPSDNTVTTAILQNASVTLAKMASESVDEDNLYISNAGTNGQYLQKQSGNDGGLTWATVSTDLSADTTPQLGGDLDTNTKRIVFGDGAPGNTNNRLVFGAGTDMQIYHDGTVNRIAGLISVDDGIRVNNTHWYQISSGTAGTGKPTGGQVLENTASGGSTLWIGGDSIYLGDNGDQAGSGGATATGHLIRTKGRDGAAGNDGYVALFWAENNYPGNNGDNEERLKTTETGLTLTGVVIPAADSTHDIGTDSVRWRNAYVDTYYGDGSNLTGVVPEGTAVKSTGESGGTKFLREDGDGTCSWQSVPAGVGGANGVDFNDGVKARFGTGNDLELYHSSDDSFISNVTDTDLIIRNTGNAAITLQTQNSYNVELKTNAEDAVKCVANGAVELYHNNVKKLETTSAGVTVAGDIVSDNDQSWQGSGNNAGAMFWDKSGDVLKFEDNTSIKWGTDADFQIYHSGADAYLKNSTGNIVIEAKAGESSIKAIPDGSVELYANGVKTFRTHDNGITLYGPEGGDGHLIMYADEGDDNADFWRLTAGADGDWVLYNYADGAYEKSISATGGGNVELYFNHSKKLETTNSSVKITGHCEPHTDDGGVNIGQSGNRWTNIFASNGTINTSDRNEKNTIQDCDLGLSFIEKLKPVSYKWNNEKAGTKTNYGLIAQDLLEVITEEGKSLDDFGPIHKDEDSAYGLNYTQLIAPLIKAVQELSTEVNTLKTEIAALKAT